MHGGPLKTILKTNNIAPLPHPPTLLQRLPLALSRKRFRSILQPFWHCAHCATSPNTAAEETMMQNTVNENAAGLRRICKSAAFLHHCAQTVQYFWGRRSF